MYYYNTVMKIFRIILCASIRVYKEKNYENSSNIRYIILSNPNWVLGKKIKRLVYYNVITRFININSFNIFFPAGK